MRILDPNTLAAQSAPSPEYRVTASFEPRGRGPYDKPVGNFAPLSTQLEGWNGRVTAVVRRADGKLLRFYVVVTYTTVELRMQVIAAPSTIAGWESPASDQQVALFTGAVVIWGLAAHVVGSTVRVYHSLNGQLRYQESTNSGATWGASVVVETLGTGEIFDVSVHYRTGDYTGGPWYVGYSVLVNNIWRPRLCGGPAGPIYVHTDGWRFGGFHHNGEEGAALTTLGYFVYRVPTLGPSRVLWLGWEPAGSTLAPQLVDWTQGGDFGVRMFAVRTRSVSGATLMLVGETAAAGGTAVLWSVVYGDAAHGPIIGGQPPAIDEPMLLPALPPNEWPGRSGGINCDLVADAAGALYFCSPSAVYRAPPIAAPAGVYEPLQYKYAVGGNLEIEFSPRGFPVVPIGALLRLERSVAKQGVGGSQAIRVRVIKREHGTDVVRLLAVDAVGELGIVRLRRPCILDPAANNYVSIARACFRAGLYVEDACDGAALQDGIGITLKPGENLSGALHRLGQRRRAWLVPDNAGLYQLTLITPGYDTRGNGEYVDAPHAYGGAGANSIPLIRAAEVVDGRRYAVAMVMGMVSPDPQEGGLMAMALGPQVEGYRPAPVTMVNRMLYGREVLGKCAQAEADRQRMVSVDAVLTAQANLALELYDVVAVTSPALGWSGKTYRVRGITEWWEKRRLTQELELGVEL